MKIHLRNRDEKIENVQLVIDEIGHWDRTKVIKEVTYSIYKDKIKKAGKEYQQGSNRQRHSIVDCYERALASVLLYCFKNSIKSDIGYFYFIKNDHFPETVKIGQTQDVETRLSNYQTCSPDKSFHIDRYFICEHPYLIENLGLQFFKERLLEGEWIRNYDTCKDLKDFCEYLETSIGLPTRFCCRGNNYKLMLP